MNLRITTKTGASVSCNDPGIFYWKESKELVMGRTINLEASFLKKLKQILTVKIQKLSHILTSHYTERRFSIIISQNSYINSITEITLNQERMKQMKDKSTELQGKDY